MTEIKVAVTSEDIASCWEAMFLLRPMLQKNLFIQQIKDLRKDGYTLLYISEGDQVVSIAGYRFITMLYSGKMLYVDDLSTLESCRGKGYATILLKHISDIAKKHDCSSVQLDSGSMRTDAHKLYFKEDFKINAFHFYKPV